MRYNKLVRDRIPEILDEKGKSYTIRNCNHDETSSYLHKKLVEEVNEFVEKPSIEELADIQEVVFALIQNMGYSRRELEFIREIKVIENGGFEHKLILEEVTD